MTADNLIVGGLVPLTTVDFPNRLSAVVFCQGCPWRCHYCHNRHLLSRQSKNPIPWSQVREFLEKRRDFLDAVVFSGGEPLMQAAIEDAVAEARGLGFRVALHTGGADPDRFARLLPSLDWIGFDVKAPFDSYARVTSVADSGRAARTSLRHLLALDVTYEVRTTVDSRILTHDDLMRLAADLSSLGVNNWVLQECRETERDPIAPPGSQADLLSDYGLLSALAKSFHLFDIRQA